MTHEHPHRRPHAAPAPRPQTPSGPATVSHGLLAWGQAGNYNGIDDRSVIAALFAGGRASGGLVDAADVHRPGRAHLRYRALAGHRGLR